MNDNARRLIAATEGHTPQPWTFGRRWDESCWFSMGNAESGEHWQFDMYGNDATVNLIAAAPVLRAELIAALEREEALQAKLDALTGGAK